MKAPTWWQLGVALVIGFSCISTVSAVKCFVCQDCEASLNETLIKDCKSSQDRCVKMVLLNGVTDRACGDKRKCAGRDQKRSSRSVSDAPKHRKVRGLLQAPSSKEQDGVKEASSIHCCSEDECNGSPTQTPILVLLYFTVILSTIYFHKGTMFVQY